MVENRNIVPNLPQVDTTDSDPTPIGVETFDRGNFATEEAYRSAVADAVVNFRATEDDLDDDEAAIEALLEEEFDADIASDLAAEIMDAVGLGVFIGRANAGAINSAINLMAFAIRSSGTGAYQQWVSAVTQPEPPTE